MGLKELHPGWCPQLKAGSIMHHVTDSGDTTAEHPEQPPPRPRLPDPLPTEQAAHVQPGGVVYCRDLCLVCEECH